MAIRYRHNTASFFLQVHFTPGVTGNTPAEFGRNLAVCCCMQTACYSVARDGDEIFVAVPENRTMDFYQYLRSFGYRFVVDCRGFCEDNVFSFAEDENVERLNNIIRNFQPVLTVPAATIR
jgi:hypothetical protein